MRISQQLATRPLHILSAVILVAVTIATMQNCGRFQSASQNAPSQSEAASLNGFSAYQNFTQTGGLYAIQTNLPYAGGPLAASNFAAANLTDSQILDCSTTLTDRTQVSSLFESRQPPSLSQSRVLVKGQILTSAASGEVQISCGQDGTVLHNYLAQDGSTPLYTTVHSNFSIVPLAGPLLGSPQTLLDAVPIDDWVSEQYLLASGKWLAGSAYMTFQSQVLNDYVTPVDCPTQPDSSAYPSTNGAVPCGEAPIESNLPMPVGSDAAHITEFDELADGTISNSFGVRIWVAANPLSDFSPATHRVFFEMGGLVYMGTLHKAGVTSLNALPDGTYTDSFYVLNHAAANSLVNAFVSTAKAGASLENAATAGGGVDLFGLGGHGVNGALAPADLRTHYAVPSNLTGAGQTIAIVGVAVTGDQLGDLNAMSDFYGLPKLQSCPSSSGPCLQILDLSGGATATGPEVEVSLDLQIAHAVAPNANLIFAVAKSFAQSDIQAAVQAAAKLPGVVAVSMSLGLGLAGDFSSVASASPSVVYLASSGDGGSGPQFPADSPFVTAVGGTRIQAISWSSSADETAWTYTGGGASLDQLMPDWQKSFLSSTLITANGGLRAIPDVAAVADGQHSPYAVYYEEQWVLTGGTSVASPLWAGLIALAAEGFVNQGQSLPTQIKAASPTGGGFNALLYKAKAANAAAFYEVTSGSNNLTNFPCPLCQTGPGYNDVTGLGAPNFTNLLAALLQLSAPTQ